MKGKNYDYNEAYNKGLTAKARLHYLENARNDTDSPFNQGVVRSEDPKDMKPKPPPPTNAELYPERRGNQGVKKLAKSEKAPTAREYSYSTQGIKKLEGGKHSPVKQVGVVDPLTGQPVQQMTNVPPQQANTLGQAQPVFNQGVQQAAQGIFGGVDQRQNSVGAAPLFKKCNKKH